LDVDIRPSATVGSRANTNITKLKRSTSFSGGRIYPLAALAEIAGCFAVWAWLRRASNLWLLPGLASLVAFGWLRTQVDIAFTGRAYATYGGV
jgi:hypothetical protein|tara:strand:+ start:17 stop:295 length:279 start_codon:yes stop_codon:yes gene_type:complete